MVMLPPVLFFSHARARRAAIASVVALWCSAVTARAQGVPAASPAQGTVCDMRYAVVSVAVVDPASHRVVGATVEVRGDGRTGVLDHASSLASGQGNASPSLNAGVGAGEYVITDDSDKARLGRARAGEWFTVIVSSGARIGRARVRLGVTQPGGCHVVRLSGPDPIVVR